MKIVFRKCNKCGNVIWTFNDSDIKCCNESMRILKENSVDASFEKHIPTYKIINDKIEVEVNHVMEDNHYIMWLMIVSDNNIEYVSFKSTDTPKAIFNYYKNSTIYAYCNLHELWAKKVE